MQICMVKQQKNSESMNRALKFKFSGYNSFCNQGIRGGWCLSSVKHAHPSAPCYSVTCYCLYDNDNGF